MTDSRTTATPETTNATPTTHLSVRESQQAIATEAEQGAIAEQQVMPSIRSGSPETAPEQFSEALGQISGRSQVGMLRHLQRNYGNSYVGRVIQAKLTVNQPGDRYEQEADRMAAQVMGMAEPQSDRSIQGVMEPKKEKEKVQMKSSLQLAPSERRGSGGELESRLNSSKGGGSPLPDDVRSFMEPRFGTSFKDVRVHTDDTAIQMNRELGSEAFTHRSDIYYGNGKAPGNNGLTAHELTHTIQQTADRASDTNIQRKQLSKVDGELVQRDGEFNVPTLDQLYSDALHAARVTGNWQDAAEKLNGFNHEDIQFRLAQLTLDEVGYIHLGALDNPRVGSQSQIAQLTKPGTPRASTAPPTASKAVPTSTKKPEAIPSPTGTNKSISDMTDIEKLIEAYNRAKINEAVREKILSLVTPKALCIAIISFAVAFVASQFTPVGWAADIGIALTGIFIGSALFAAINHLIGFANARNATTPEELDQAGAEFAQAVAEIEIDALILLVTHGVGGGPKAGVPLESTSTTRIVLGVTREGVVVPVVAETVPATTISVAAGAQIGVKGAAAATSLLSTGSGSGKKADLPNRLSKDEISPGMEIDPKKSAVFRGGKSFNLKPNEYKTDPTTGLVKPTHGASLDVDPSNVAKFGGANQMKSIPPDLKIIQRGARLEHFEIVPRKPISVEQFQELLNQIEFY
jgi:Domain of unknown function (DUF4157)